MELALDSMAMVLTPILKGANFNSPKTSTPKSSKVAFSLPEDNIESVIQYLSEESTESFSVRLNTFLKILLSPESEDVLLTKWIKEFKDNIFFLDKRQECIIFALLRLNWSSRTEELVLAYQELILNLVSAHTEYIKNAFGMIVKLFMTVSDENKAITEDEKLIFQNGHELLKQILALVPVSPDILCSLLNEMSPYFKRSSHVMECYMENMLTICTYLPTKRPFLLEMLVVKMIYIDVHCSKEIIELYEQERKNQQELMMDGVEMEEDSTMAFPLANNLDVLMNSMFKFIHSVCFPDGKCLEWECTRKLYKELLTIFERVILLTREICHVQYLLVYICSLKAELCEGFLDYLWKKVQNGSPVARQAAAFYIGSLLARTSYISIWTVTLCFDLMCAWIHSYIDNQEASQDLRIHGTFHSVCQAVFYVFAFRIRELIDIKNSFKYLRSLNLERIVSCHLNPLKYCDRVIVQNFASVARNYQIAYCYTVIEKNNRSLVCRPTEGEGPSGAMIDTFFPFDSYALKRSKAWVQSFHRAYHKNEESESIPEQDSSPKDALFMYSVSPGFKMN